MSRRNNPIIRSQTRGRRDSYNPDLAALGNVSLLSKRQEATVCSQIKKDRRTFLRRPLTISVDKAKQGNEYHVLHSNRFATGSEFVENFMG